MSTRRIESPRYGMVVTDGIAGHVWMIVRQSYPDDTGDSRFVWEAVWISTTPQETGTKPFMPGRVFLAPGEFAEVV